VEQERLAGIGVEPGGEHEDEGAAMAMALGGQHALREAEPLVALPRCRERAQEQASSPGARPAG
jgi:hypothetical protein